MFKYFDKTARILFFLFISTFFLINNQINVHAQGPMPDEIAKDMLSINAFSMPYNTTATDDERDVIKTALNSRPSIVQIQVGSQFGTGNIYSIDNEKIRIITAAHVVKNWNEADDHYVIFFNGRISDAGLLAADDVYDAAVIEVSTSSLESFDLMNLRAVNLNFSAFSAFDSSKNKIVLALDSDHKINAREVQNYDYYGNGTGIGSKYIYGSVIHPNVMVTDYGYKMIYVNCSAHSGMSGGGVFDIRGNYLGILVGGSESGQTVVVRLPDIRDLLSDLEAASSDELSGE